MLEADQLIELHVFKRAMFAEPASRLFSRLLGEELDLASHGLARASEFERDASLGGAARKIGLDLVIEAASLLPVGGRVGGAGMTGATRLAAVALYGLRVFSAVVEAVLDGASCSAAGA